MKRLLNYTGHTNDISKYNNVIHMMSNSPIPCCGPWNRYLAISMRPHTHIRWEHRTVPCREHESPSIGLIHLNNPALNPVARRLKRSVPHLGKLGKVAI